MKKQLPALLAAITMTGIITLVMFVTSANALLNKDTVNVSSTSNNTTNSAAVSSASKAQIDQLQKRIDEYAQREQQYKQREQQYQQAIQNNQDQVQQAALQIQQIRQLLSALQERGLIRIDGNGSIVITGRSGN